MAVKIDDLTKGNLESRCIARIFGQLCVSRVCGTLFIEHNKGKSKILFKAGFPGGAQAGNEVRGLGLFLLKRGIINPEAFNSSLADGARTGKSQGRILVENGYISADALGGYLREFWIDSISKTLSIKEGTWRFETGETVSTWSGMISLDPFDVLITFLDQESEVARVNRILEDIQATPSVFRGDPALASRSVMDAEIRNFIDELKKTFILNNLPLKNNISRRKANAALAALICLGLISKSSEEPATFSYERQILKNAPDKNLKKQESSAPAKSVSVPRESGSGTGSARGPVSSPEKDARKTKILLQALETLPGANRLAARYRKSSDDRSSSGKSSVSGSSAPPPMRANPLYSDSVFDNNSQNGQGKEKKPDNKDFAGKVMALADEIKKHDFYVRLDIPHSASQSMVKKAYLDKVKKYHPDQVTLLGLSSDAGASFQKVFVAIQEAFETLKDDELRKKYDDSLKAGTSRHHAEENRSKAIAQLNFKRGEYFFKKRDYKKAIEYFEPALYYEPDMGKCIVMRAWSIYSIGPPEKVEHEVREDLLRASKFEESTGIANYYLGILARINEDYESALKHFTVAVSLEPNPEAASELRHMQRKIGREES